MAELSVNVFFIHFLSSPPPSATKLSASMLKHWGFQSMGVLDAMSSSPLYSPW